MKTYVVVLLILSSNLIFAQNNFYSTLHSSDWEQPMGIAFSSTGKMFVWEKKGMVYTYDGSHKTLILDISQEVGNYGDHGLIGLALDPDFMTNGYFYLFYIVDRHHLLYYGTPDYDPSADIYHQATISRVTRYTANINDNFNSVDINSRKILIGESISTGFPIIGGGHSGGGITFGKDGTLLIACGDTGADDESSNDVQAYNDGIMTSQELTKFRPLILESLNGKIVRIDPNTGDGLPSNPFYDANNPRSKQSRIWATGFRNPFRMTLKPNTGSHNPTDANPGTFYVADVGEVVFEEINAVSGAGKSYGWPNWEGMDYNYIWYNPNYDFITPTKPAIAWEHPPAVNVKTNHEGIIHSIGEGGFIGDGFNGSASIGGIWYNGSSLPSIYQNTFIAGNFDYENPGWIKSFHFDEDDGGLEFNHVLSVSGLTHIAYNEFSDMIYYISYPDKIYQLRYGSSNLPPTAVISKNLTYGTSPLTVEFDASQSSDPENGQLSYLWDFGDGSNSTLINPTHTFLSTNGSSPQKFTVSLIVVDDQNQSKTTTSVISINNTPPTIASLSIDNMDFFANVGQTHLLVSAVVNDIEHTDSQLTYKWDVALHHNTHHHSEPSVFTNTINAVLENVPCDNNLYYYKISLTVTDAAGLSSSRSKSLYPTCCFSSLSLVNPTDNYNSTTVKKLESSSNTEAQNIINAGAKVIYDARNSILLKPGFQANSGATFSAYIDGCGNK